MKESDGIRILIADDHAVVREGLAAILQQHPPIRVVGQAGSGREAVALYREHQPDVTLMDLRMPEMDGVEAIATIREAFPNARIIVLTTYDGDEDVYQALRTGAKGYLLKDAGREALLEAIRTVHAGKTYIPLEVAAKLAQHLSGPEISERERDVLRLIAQGRSNQEIATALFIGEATVKTHVSNILTKLNASDRTQAVTIALRRGLVRLE